MLAASGALLAVSLAANAAGATALAQIAALLTIVSGGGPSVRRAWSALRLRTFDMHVLMTVAVAGAIAIGEWMEGATRRLSVRPRAVPRIATAWNARATPSAR